MEDQDAQPDIHAALADMLQSMSDDGQFEVDAVLKEGPVEQTQRVYRRRASGGRPGPSGGRGPFIRKYIRLDSDLGGIYRLLNDAYEHGRHLEHLPQVYTCNEIGDQLVVLMEYVPGRTLAQCVSDCTNGRERLDLAIRTFPLLCDAAQELHSAFERPIVHRDLTPTNVMVSDAPCNVTLIDFGISRTYKPEADSDTAYLGTRPYAPPEQYGFGQTDVRSDIYALCAILFFCLAGKPMTRHDRTTGFKIPGIADEMSHVIATACSLDARDRYASCADLKRAFHLAATWASTDARSATAWTDTDAKNAAARPNAKGAASQEAFHTGQPDTSEPFPASPFSHIPTWLGRTWNVFVTMTVVLFDAAIVDAVPTMNMHGQPRWYSAFYLVFTLVLFTTPGYFMLDKRRLRARLGRTKSPSIQRQLATCALIIAADAAFLFVSNCLFTALGLMPPIQ